MKIFIFIFILFVITSPSDADYNINSRSLEVPEDPNEWVFKGENNSYVRDGRISLGQRATDTQFPWAARMSINLEDRGIRCTGSLIKANWIVSARQCIADTNAISVQVELGSADEQNFRVKCFSDMFVWMNVNIGDHPDIALFRLTNDLTLNSYVNTIRLPSRVQENFRFQNFTITACGWGVNGTGILPRYLQWTYFRVLAQKDCKINPNLMCSQPPSGSSSLQTGDAGGSSVIYEENGTPTLVGINVLVLVDGANRWQGSTPVSSFLNFISDVTGIQIRNV